MIGMIAAVSREGVIGLRGGLPWASHCYPGDLKRFRRVTMGATVIMGRKTWESMGQRLLPGRENVVVRGDAAKTAPLWPDRRFATSLDQAIAETVVGRDIWLIGGARIYEAGLKVADVVDLTLVPFSITDPDAVRFPAMEPREWDLGLPEAHPDEPTLHIVRRARKMS